MECARIRELIDPYLDGELSKKEAAALEEHLQTCSKCAYESTQILRMKEVIQRWQGVNPSGTVKEEVLAKVRKDMARRGTPRERYIRRAILSAVGLALVTMGGIVSVVYLIDRGTFRKPPATAGTTTNGPETGMPAPAVAASFARVVNVSGDAVRVIGRDGDIYRPSEGHEILPGETVEVGETSLLVVDVAGGRVLVGGIAWRGKAPSFGLSGPTRLRFASPEAGLNLVRGTVRVLTGGGGVGDIRFRTHAGTIYVPWTGPGDETAEVSIHVATSKAAVGVSGGEAGVLITRKDGTTQNVSVKKGRIVEVDQDGEVVERPK